jgi:transcriptional regulator with XRE-family HTH domain
MQDRRTELGTLAKRRRLTLGLQQEEIARRAGLRSRTTVISFEAGRSVKQATLWKLDTGYGWKPGSSELFLETGQLPEIAKQVDEFTDPAERRIWGIAELSEARRREVIAELRAERARLRAAAEDERDEDAS